MAEKPKYYWDACAWIALIQQESGRFDALSYVIDEAKAKRVEIWTSTFTLAEVYKRRCGDEQKSLPQPQDQAFEDLILQDFVERVQVDYDVGVLARRLLRAYPIIKLPQDGIHLATALLNNVDVLHTFDRENLIGLSEQIYRKDGKKLKICEPPKRPPPPEEQPKPMTLFDKLNEPNETKPVPAKLEEAPAKNESPMTVDAPKTITETVIPEAVAPPVNPIETEKSATTEAKANDEKQPAAPQAPPQRRP